MAGARFGLDSRSRRLLDKLNPDEARRAVESGVRSGAGAWQRALVMGTPQPRAVGATGQYRAGWLVAVRGLAIAITHRFRYARFPELGWRRTKPIYPVSKQALSWIPGRGAFSAARLGRGTFLAAGRRVTVGKVTKPAHFAGYHVFRKTAPEAAGVVLKIIGRNIRKAFVGA